MLTLDKMAANAKWRAVLLICTLISLREVTGSQEVMAKLSGGFAKVMEACKNELGVADSIVQEFHSYWREDYALVNRDMGCMVICMASKLNLLTDEMKMDHGSAHEFVKAHGADDDTAKQIVTMLHECEKAPFTEDDPCLRTLEISKCFRSKIHELKWAPNMELVIEEVMTGVKT